MNLYSSLPNQLYHWAHYLFAVCLIFIIIPQLMFENVTGSRLDKILANFLRMLFFMVLTGFLLVITKLFEVLGIVGVIILWMVWQRGRGTVRIEGWSTLTALAFDVVELPQILLKGIRRFPEFGRGAYHRLSFGLRRLRPSVGILSVLASVCVLTITLYIRLYTAVLNAAPKMSDGDTLLAWVKYINLRILMHDGVYPQGFFFYMSVLSKFAVTDALYVLNYTGPLDTVMIVFMMFFLIRKLTGSTIGALVAATLYGILGEHLLMVEWARQSGSETQEFGFFLVFPTVYFLNRFLKDGQKIDFWAAFAGICDTGLVHPLSYVLCVMACVSVLVAYTISGFYEVKQRLWQPLVGGVASGIVTLIPYILAFLYGIHSNQAAQSFITATSPPSPSTTSSSGTTTPAKSFLMQLHLNTPTRFDLVAIACIVFLLVLGIRGAVRGKPQIVWLLSGIWGFACYSLYEIGAPVSRSVVLESRMLDLWAIVEAFVIGMGIAALFKLIENVTWRKWLEGVGSVGLVSLAIILSPPMPILPAPVQWNDDIDAYFQINAAFRGDGYMIVSPDFEYALVLGNGPAFHMLTRDFLKMYDPRKPPLTRFGASHPDRNIAQNVFVYYYKRIYKVPKNMGIYSLYVPMYQQEFQNRKHFQQWLKQYTAANGHDYKVFFNSPVLKVYEFTVRN